MAIEIATRSLTRLETLLILDPIVAEWFSIFEDLTPSQRYALINIHEGRNTLIAGPTGSAKSDSRSITVLPSLSPLAYGSDVSETRMGDFLSPILRQSSLDELTPYLIEPGVAVKKFPKLRYP